jgi:hypothetical protein
MAWFSSLDDVQMLRDELHELVSAELVTVRYLTLDYTRFAVAADHSGPRAIADETEWTAPHWTHPIGDGVDFGVELDLSSGRTLSIAWEPPGSHESLEVFPGRLIGSLLDDEPDVAVWDVTARSRWTDLVGRTITAIDPHYIPWAPNDGYWCTRVALHFGAAAVVLLLRAFTENGDLTPSANNIAVLFSADYLQRGSCACPDARSADMAPAIRDWLEGPCGSQLVGRCG